MSQLAATQPVAANARPINYLNCETTAMRRGSTHARPQARRHHVPRVGHALLPRRRHLRDARSSRAVDAWAHDHVAQRVQQDVHAPRHHDDLPLHDPGDPVGVRKLRLAAHARRKRRRISAAEPRQLLRLPHGRGVRGLGDDPRRRRHRLDLLRAVLDHHDHRDPAGAVRHLHHRLLEHHDRAQLHRDRAHYALAGHDLEPHPAVRVGDVRDRRSSRCSPRRSSGSRPCSSPSSASSTSVSSIQRRAATRC